MTRNRTLLWLLVPGGLSAQPIITTDNMPILGDVVPIGICSDPIDTVALNASAGAMMTWDFSGLTEQTEEQFLFVDPVGSLWENDFPTSSLCGISWDGSHAYYTTTSGMLEQDGLCTIVPGPPPEDTAKVLLTTDSESLMSLPLAFGDTHSDVFSGTFEAGGFIGAVDGTIDLVADGHGTLVLPNGTFSNVLRYRFDRVQNNTVLGTTTSTSKVQWGWCLAPPPPRPRCNGGGSPRTTGTGCCSWRWTSMASTPSSWCGTAKCRRSSPEQGWRTGRWKR